VIEPDVIDPTSAAALAFVDDLVHPVLSISDRHHLERVLRLRSGAEVAVGDGRGSWRPCRFGSELEPIGPVIVEPRPEPPIGVGFALVKGDRPELVVQKLTELGVDRIVPFTAARSVVRWDETKAGRQQERLVVIAREAAMQCRRTWLPEIAPLCDLAEVAAMAGAVIADRGGDQLAADDRFVLVGPEGGWTPEELGLGVRRVQLANHVLRAETAAIAAGALLCANRDRRL
jgi:16S rRNA (uracil1498-N3)-methyltransferase